MNLQLFLDLFGILSIAASAVKELISNWKGDFLAFKRKRRLIKVILSTISAVYNAVTVIRGLKTHDGYILYQGNPTVAVYVFSAAAILGIVVGATEDYYKRYSTSRPNFIAIFVCTLSLTLTFTALIIAQGIFSIEGRSARTSGIVMIAVSAPLAIIILTVTPWMSKTVLRISLLVNVGVIPGLVIFILVVDGYNGRFTLAYLGSFLSSMILYVSYMYPIQILIELFALALINRQRKKAYIDEQPGASPEAEGIEEAVP